MPKFKSLAVILIMVMLIGIISGCSKSGGSAKQGSVSKDVIFDFYNKVQISQTKDEVDAELGVVGTESTQLDNSYTYTDENTSYGVSVLFDDQNQVMSRTLIYPERKDLAFLCSKSVTQKQADKITDGMSYDDVKSILGGEGIDINETQIPFDDNKSSYIRIWVNKDGSMIQVVFGTDGNSNNATFFDS